MSSAGFCLVFLELASRASRSSILADGALHGDGEGAHGAFQALEEVHLHHADEEFLAFSWLKLDAFTFRKAP
jgi:hypothetical protein